MVTGAGSGIGAACARGLVHEGYEVALIGRRVAPLVKLAEELRASGGRARVSSVDVTQEAQVSALFDDLPEVSVLINNAGAATSAPLRRTTLDEVSDAIAVNAIGPFLCTRAVLPGMCERKYGRIVNILSVSGLVGNPYTTAYTMSKHSAVGLTKVAAAEAARYGVTVNGVCPNYVASPMTDETIERIQKKTGLEIASAEEQLVGHTPLRRLLDPAEVAAVALFLASPAAAGVIGQMVVLNA